jgi:hypothetical protein
LSEYPLEFNPSERQLLNAGAGQFKRQFTLAPFLVLLLLVIPAKARTLLFVIPAKARTLLLVIPAKAGIQFCT